MFGNVSRPRYDGGPKRQEDGSNEGCFHRAIYWTVEDIMAFGTGKRE